MSLSLKKPYLPTKEHIYYINIQFATKNTCFSKLNMFKLQGFCPCFFSQNQGMVELGCYKCARCGLVGVGNVKGGHAGKCCEVVLTMFVVLKSCCKFWYFGERNSCEKCWEKNHWVLVYFLLEEFYVYFRASTPLRTCKQIMAEFSPHKNLPLSASFRNLRWLVLSAKHGAFRTPYRGGKETTKRHPWSRSSGKNPDARSWCPLRNPKR